MEGHAPPAETTGRMIVVVGPSGAGKDTLLQFAAERLQNEAQLRFVRRVITRAASAGGEEHDSLSDEAFQRLEREGGFAVSWIAHGLRYGIPRQTLDDVAAGRCLVANGSRSALPLFRQAYADLLVVNVTARPDMLAERLVARGRECRADILARLQRSSLSVHGNYRVETIDNSGPVEVAGQQMVEIFRRCLSKRR
jgi:ribose 1,5-bisphosphokinase